MRRGILLGSLLAGALCASAVAADATACRDPLRRRATIGGDRIRGTAVSGSIPLQGAAVRLYSSGTLLWAGATNKTGSFEIPLHPLTFIYPCAAAGKFECPPAAALIETVAATYTLVVAGWGRVEITIDPQVDRELFQRGQWSLHLSDGPCVGSSLAID